MQRVGLGCEVLELGLSRADGDLRTVAEKKIAACNKQLGLPKDSGITD